MKKRIISLLLAFVMVVSVIPVRVFAETVTESLGTHYGYTGSTGAGVGTLEIPQEMTVYVDYACTAANSYIHLQGPNGQVWPESSGTSRYQDEYKYGYYARFKVCLSIRNCIKRAPKSTVPGQHRFGFEKPRFCSL